MSRINYNHLRYFWAVAHDGNLTRTAETLNLSQSALSVQIRKLEEQLGHQLFERVGRKLELTEAGRLTLEHADTIFASGDDLLHTLQGRGEGRKVLRVGAVATLSRNFQLSFLRPVLGRPDVEVILSSASYTELLARLEAMEIDVALVTRPPGEAAARRFLAQPIVQQAVSLVGHRDLATGDGGLGGLLRRHPLILPPRGSAVRYGFDALCESMELTPRVAAEVDDMAMMRLLARDRVGLALVPPIVVQDELENGLLKELEVLPDIHETFYGVTLQRRFPNPLVRQLLG